MRILIVEDEVRLATMMKEILVQAKYFVDVVHDGESGIDYATSGIYDGIIFDAMLPKIDGFAAIRTLRQDENLTTPILLLTARSQTADRVQGLDAGADYYLTKPFQKEELLACLRALLRRQGGEHLREELSFGDLTIDLNNNTITCKDQSIQLSTREFELARLLISHQDNVVPKETIFLKIWGYDSEAESNVVEAYVSFLRRKLKHIGSEFQLVAVRKKGYRLFREETP